MVDKWLTNLRRLTNGARNCQIRTLNEPVILSMNEPCKTNKQTTFRIQICGRMDVNIGTLFSHYRAWRNFEPWWWWRSGKKLEELLPYAAARSVTRCLEGMRVRWPSHQSTNIWVACIICETRRWLVSSPTPAAAASIGRQRNQENVKHNYFLGS